MTRTRLVRAGRYVVAIDVEMIVPPDDSSEPCYESETAERLREVKEHAERGDLSRLKDRGTVYELVEA